MVKRRVGPRGLFTRNPHSGRLWSSSLLPPKNEGQEIGKMIGIGFWNIYIIIFGIYLLGGQYTTDTVRFA